MAVEVYTKTGSKSSTSIKLDSKVFGIKDISENLLKQAYNNYLGNGRQNIARTLKRGEVRGGGRKPWRQKGTGRARHGSIRSPIWTGGGVTFGPSGEENYKRSMSRRMKRSALKQALTTANQASKIKVIDSFDVKDAKTKSAAELLNKIGATRRVLLVVENKTPEIVRSTNNLQNVKLVQAVYVNTHDVLDADTILFEKAALEQLTDLLNKERNNV